MFHSTYFIDHKKAFEEFKALAGKHGLTAVDHGHGHWQVRGGARIVNYYPSKGTVYICGDSKSKRRCSPEVAVQVALAVLPPEKKDSGGFLPPKNTPVEKSGSYQLKGGFLSDTKPE